MFRKKKSKKKTGDVTIRLRGHEITRIETFSDCIFAFALTLLIVSLEVPKSFIELEKIIWDFPVFFLVALLLYTIWNEQNEFFRDYGMKDKFAVQLNAILLFVVLFYVYPLKFLSAVVFGHNQYLLNGEVHYRVESAQQNAHLLLIYGAGYLMVYITFILMYAHALRKKDELQLNEIEIFQTKTSMYSRMWMAGIGIVSVLITLTGYEAGQVYAGLIFTLIWPVLSIFFSYRKKRMRKIFGEAKIAEHIQLTKG